MRRNRKTRDKSNESVHKKLIHHSNWMKSLQRLLPEIKKIKKSVVGTQGYKLVIEFNFELMTF